MTSLSKNPEQLLFIREIKAVTNKSIPTIDRWIKAGTFPAPHGKVNGMRYWLKSDVDQWLGNLLYKDESAFNELKSHQYQEDAA